MSMPPGGGTPPPPLEGLDPVGAQERFLTSSGSGDTEQGRGEPGMDPESLMAASQGLEGVVHDGSLGQKQTALTPGSSTPGMSQSSRGV